MGQVDQRSVTTTAQRQHRITVVVPTIRAHSIERFVDEWSPQLDGRRLIVVEDNPTKTFRLPRRRGLEHYAWNDIDRRLGNDSWIIPRRSDCVRSFGYLLAAQRRCDVIVTLDDDCYPEKGANSDHLEMMAQALERTWPTDRWINTLDGDVHPRGFPYDIRERRIATVIHHGLWSQNPDLDARTQLARPTYMTRPARGIRRIPTGAFFPMCGMNLAFRPEWVPAMYFLLMGRGAKGKPWPYDRFGDIWAGIFAKKVADHLGLAVSSGAPSVHHARASNPEVNLRKETPGYPINERLWKVVDRIHLTETTPAAAYSELAAKLTMRGAYWDKLRIAMRAWTRLTAA